MGFKSYACHEQPDGVLTLDDPQPLVLSGPKGLIACHVLGAGENGRGPWKLCAGELHALAKVDVRAHGRLIVFEQAEDDRLEVLELKAINGLSSQRTDLMLSFSPLIVIQASAPLTVRRSEINRTYGEDLTLDGGIDAPKEKWRWTKPHLALGGVVLGPAAGKSPAR
jgi:hypothetical protein